jgi:two-component system, LytTR family, response regulator
MINALIIEDDADNAIFLRRLLKSALPAVKIDGEAQRVQSAFDLIKKTSPLLVFLDIELLDGTAFDLLDKIMPVDFEIIFTTAHNDYILKAIRYSALDYLLKPIDPAELISAVKRAGDNLDFKNINYRISNLLNNIKKNDEFHRIALPVKDGFDFVDITDIARCESASDCTVVHTKSGKKYVSLKTTKEFEKILPSNRFFRVHHSSIVNIDFIRKYYKEGRGGYVELLDGTIVTVAYRRKDDFLSQFGYS